METERGAGSGTSIGIVPKSLPLASRERSASSRPSGRAPPLVIILMADMYVMLHNLCVKKSTPTVTQVSKLAHAAEVDRRTAARFR